MKYIKSIHSLKVLRTEGRSKRRYNKIRQPSKFADNLGNKPNDVQIWRSYSSLDPVSKEDQLQAN